LLNSLNHDQKILKEQQKRAGWAMPREPDGGSDGPEDTLSSITLTSSRHGAGADDTPDGPDAPSGTTLVENGSGTDGGAIRVGTVDEGSARSGRSAVSRGSARCLDNLASRGSVASKTSKGSTESGRSLASYGSVTHINTVEEGSAKSSDGASKCRQGRRGERGQDPGLG